LAIRHAFREYETAHTDGLNEDLFKMNIAYPISGKFGTKIINHCSTPSQSMDWMTINKLPKNFSLCFAQIYNGLPNATNNNFDNDLNATELRNGFNKNLIDFELVNKCIHNLKL